MFKVFILPFLRFILSYFSLLKTIFFTALASLQLDHGKGLKVNARCFFGTRTTVGNDCHFNGMQVHGVGKLVIGNHFHSGSEIMVITSSHNYKSAKLLPYDFSEIVRDVNISDAVWLGSRVILLPGTDLARGVVVQAGSVVHGKIPEGAIIGGNPAKVLFYRDLELLSSLYSSNKFV